MKSNKNFHKVKKIKPVDDGSDLKGKKVSAIKKDKYFKKEIFDEIDEFEDIEEYDPDKELDDIEDEDYINEEGEEDFNYDEEDDHN